MKVLFATACASRNAGGLFMTVRQLAQALAYNKYNIEVVSIKDERGDEDLKEWHPVVPKLCSTYPFCFGYRPSLEMYQVLNNSNVEIVHVHGIRTWPSLVSRVVCRRKNIPYIVSPHGQLDSWVMQQARIKKRLLHSLVEDRTLHLADALHATCLKEYEYIRAMGFQNPVILLPNGINIGDYEKSSAAKIHDFWPELHNRKVLLYLSLINPKKGLDMLAAAWNRLCEIYPDWVLVIAGAGNRNYEIKVRRMFEPSCLKKQTLFVGACYGGKKQALFSDCAVFILPTYTENFGNVVLEAMASKKPVITTKGAPWAILEKEQAGWWVDIDTKNISEAIEDALSLSDDKLESMGERGFQYAAANFAWSQLGAKMAESYEFLAGNKTRPEFLIDD